MQQNDAKERNNKKNSDSTKTSAPFQLHFVIAPPNSGIAIPSTKPSTERNSSKHHALSAAKGQSATHHGAAQRGLVDVVFHK